jgi:hypothetical protein
MSGKLSTEVSFDTEEEETSYFLRRKLLFRSMLGG